MMKEINFYPNRLQMLQEIERCTASGNLDTLLSYCNSCAYKVLSETTLVSQCLKCRIQQGITKISNAKKKWTATPDHEFLGVC